MRLSFNTTGPCYPDEHYMLPPERRLGHVRRLIEERKYFTFHAGRQTGKTTSAMWLTEHLNATGAWRAVWVDIETARERPEPAAAFRTILENLSDALSWVDLPRPDRSEVEGFLENPDTAIRLYLRWISAADPRPLVVFFDEADGLVGPAMVSFLTQLRQGYIERRHAPFPSSVVLVGLRQVRDYVLTESERRAVTWLGTTSPFNVNAEAATVGPFTRDEVGELLAQHTAATGQRFLPEAVDRVWELGRGHPWLTNALADQVVNRDVEDRSIDVTAAHVEAAKETIILQRRTHIDSLVSKLREPRVRKVVEPMLVGGRPADLLDDDVAYVVGLGLLSLEGGGLRIANPIYREVIPRALTWSQQVSIAVEPAWYVLGDGRLDVSKLLAAFQKFWREDGHLAAEGFGYREAGPHLMLMAFLQRVVNGGGRIVREYGIGRGALDLLIEWPTGDRYAVEVKLRRDTETEADALAQVARYLDGLGLSHGWLVMFDLRKELPWSERLTTREADVGGKRVTIVGC